MIPRKKSAGAFFLSKIKNNQIYYNLRAETMKLGYFKKELVIIQCG